MSKHRQSSSILRNFVEDFLDFYLGPRHSPNLINQFEGVIVSLAITHHLDRGGDVEDVNSESILVGVLASISIATVAILVEFCAEFGLVISTQMFLDLQFIFAMSESTATAIFTVTFKFIVLAQFCLNFERVLIDELSIFFLGQELLTFRLGINLREICRERTRASS